MKTRAILNPRAGLASRRALAALEGRRPFWPDLEVRMTEGPGHARDLAREAASLGWEKVLAVGGDGTANEAAWGVLGSETSLGLVPVGSGNGLARTLGVPLDPVRALQVLEPGVVRRMDVGMVNGRPFLNVAGAGFDAAVGAAFHARGKEGGRRGVLTYVRLGLGMAFSYKAQDWTLAGDGSRVRARVLVVAFANGRQYGGGAVIAPRARLDDGRLDVVVIEDAPRLEILLQAPRLFLGGIERFRRYRHLALSAVVLSGADPIAHHRDGEPEDAAASLEIRVEPRALAILVPRATAEDPEGPFLPARA